MGTTTATSGWAAAGLLPAEHAIVAVDLADRVQSVVVCDHDLRVLARRRVRVRVWELGPVLAWAATQARRAGLEGDGGV